MEYQLSKFIKAHYTVLLASNLMLISINVTAAKDVDPSIAAAAERSILLDTVIITSRKREENIQKVPVSISVIHEDQQQILPSTTNGDIARSVPNFNFVDSGGTNSNHGNIRGVGSFSPLSGDDTSVVFYVDEVPLSVYGTPPNLLDTERVEVMRGPQGTLFGRNTQGGAVNIVTKAPEFSNSLTINTEIGTDGYANGQLIGNAVIVPDVIAGRLAVSYNRFDGDIPNIVVGGKEGGVEIGAARGTLLFSPDAGTEGLLSFNYNGNKSHTPRFMLGGKDFPISATDPKTLLDTDTYGFSYRFRHDFKKFQLISLTSLQKSNSKNVMDMTDSLVMSKMTGRPPSIFDVPDTNVMEFGELAFMQELRLASLPEDDLAWVAGANYYRSDATMDRDADVTTPMYYSINGIQANDFLSNSYSAFGEITAPMADKLKATLGLRASHEDKWAKYEFDGNKLSGVVPYKHSEMSLSENSLTGRAGLSYEWTEAFMTYGTISRGHVSAGFPIIAVNAYMGKDEAEFPASESWTYETGFKSQILDNRLTISGSIFYNDVKDGHIVVFDSSQAMLSVATMDYRTYGGELELTANIADDLDVIGGVGYTHSELINLPEKSNIGARNGNKVPNTADFTANFGVQYRLSGDKLLLPGDFICRINYQYVGTREANLGNTFSLDYYSLVNARITWYVDDKSIYILANNIFDERYELWGQSFGAVPTYRVGQGRVVGIGTSFKF